MPDDNRRQGPSNDAPRDPLDDLIAPILNRDVPVRSTRALARLSVSNNSRRDPLDDLLTDAELHTEILPTPVASVKDRGSWKRAAAAGLIHIRFMAASAKGRVIWKSGNRLWDRVLVIVAICLFGTAAAIVGETQFGPPNRQNVWNQQHNISAPPTKAVQELSANPNRESLPNRMTVVEQSKPTLPDASRIEAPTAKPAPQVPVALPEPSAQKLTPEELYEKVSPSVVRVSVFNARGELLGHGSGFFVRDDSTVVTNFHVIEDGHSAEVVLSDGTTLLPVLGVEAFDMQSDVAILRVSAEKQKKIRPLILGGDELPQPASKAYVIGSPAGLDNSFSDGSVSGHREMDGRTWIQTTAPISPGSSGSPLFNERGLVIGVATKSRVSGQNLNLALASLHLRKLLPNRMGLPIRMTELPSRKPPQKHAADPAKPVDGDIFTAIRVATMDAASLSGDPRTRAMRTVLERLESVPAEEKQKVAYWATRSFIHSVNRRRQLSLDDAEEAVRIDPKDKRGWQALLNELQHPTGDSERKRRLEVHQHLIQLAGEDVPAWDYKDIGNAYRGLKRYDEAVVAYGKALVRDPKCGDAYYGLGDVHKNRKRYVEAIANFKKSIEFPSTTLSPSFGYLGLAECYERMRDYREAIRAEEKALELLPEGFDDLEKNIRETLGRTRFLQAME